MHTVKGIGNEETALNGHWFLVLRIVYSASLSLSAFHAKPELTVVLMFHQLEAKGFIASKHL